MTLIEIATRLQFLPLIWNTTLFLLYLFAGDEPGKTVYWAGAAILTLGLVLMKG